jgi:hypothetical protein
MMWPIINQFLLFRNLPLCFAIVITAKTNLPRVTELHLMQNYAGRAAALTAPGIATAAYLAAAVAICRATVAAANRAAVASARAATAACWTAVLL